MVRPPLTLNPYLNPTGGEVGTAHRPRVVSAYLPSYSPFGKHMSYTWTQETIDDVIYLYDGGADAKTMVDSLGFTLEHEVIALDALTSLLDERDPDLPPLTAEEANSGTEGTAVVKKEPTKGEAPKKSAAKKPTPKKAVKKAKKTKKGKKKEVVLSKAQKVGNLINSVNTHMKSSALVPAQAANTSYLLRRPSGILSLDIALAGGYPAGSMCQICGPDGAGKDYLLGRAFAEQQKIHGDDCALALWNNEFKLDKMFFRNICGVEVALTGEEIDEQRAIREKMGYKPLTSEEEDELTNQIGQFVLIAETLADKALDVVLDLLHANLFQIIAINSLGNLQTIAKDSTDSLGDFAQQSNEALLISKFFPKFFSSLNGYGEDGEKNETTVLATNQMRGKRDVRKMPGRTLSEGQKTQSALQAHSLKHGKAIDIVLEKGANFIDSTIKPPMRLGREIRWRLEKGKLGTHDGIRGSYNYYYDYGADDLEDLYAVATRMGVIQQNGAHYRYEDPEVGEFRAHGKDGIKRELMKNPAIVESIREACILDAGILARYQ